MILSNLEHKHSKMENGHTKSSLSTTRIFTNRGIVAGAIRKIWLSRVGFIGRKEK